MRKLTPAEAAQVARVRHAFKSGAVRYYRVSRGLSQGELGATVGKSSAEIGRYERGEVTPRAATALALGEALGELLSEGS